ncbi:hypothetical protein Q8A67_009813 [Cirrhinus molitorella]|uniref:Uncharacterized protein n=1 Tax=Cirrhinus molitorella TaxID=172907 RepID=A0AA88TNP1_9TELE|nr:hypothetical protein Q8A67_009813 [Cirrhinus molitorella]
MGDDDLEFLRASLAVTGLSTATCQGSPFQADAQPPPAVVIPGAVQAASGPLEGVGQASGERVSSPRSASRNNPARPDTSSRTRASRIL